MTNVRVIVNSWDKGSQLTWVDGILAYLHDEGFDEDIAKLTRWLLPMTQGGTVFQHGLLLLVAIVIREAGGTLQSLDNLDQPGLDALIDKQRAVRKEITVTIIRDGRSTIIQMKGLPEVDTTGRWSSHLS
jgi:hypothetical protein